MLIYMLSKKETRKIPINSDTLAIVESLINSGKYTVPGSLENEMHQFFDKYKVFYRLIRKHD
jgi:hypothetical protein